MVSYIMYGVVGVTWYLVFMYGVVGVTWYPVFKCMVL